MAKYGNLDKRMKEYYEQIPKTKLMRRVPVCIRLDGKAFHTFTKHFKRPFDEILIKSMQETAKYLCENIQGCVLSYQQSDEITLILVDYQKLTTSAWFDYEVQKMTSVAASMATMAFNKAFAKNAEQWCENYFEAWNHSEEDNKYYETLQKAVEQGAVFDARVFNIPKEEVANLVLWRQNDASRNSVQMVRQAYFSHKELEGKSCSDIQNMLMIQKGVNWNDFPTYQKRGSCVIKNRMVIEPYGSKMMCKNIPEGHWFVDKEIPIFKGEGREYIECLVYIDEQKDFEKQDEEEYGER